MLRNSLLVLFVGVALLACPTPAYACPMCKEAVESNPQLAAMYNWSILALVTLPFALVAVIADRTARALNPGAYQAAQRRVTEFLWPKGWLYLAFGLAALALLFYVTTPPDPASQLRLPSTTLERQPAFNPNAPLPQLQGRVVVVTFFASWCPPCVEQMADLARLQQEFAGEAVAIVAISAFEDEATPPGIPHLHEDGTLEFHAGAPDLPSFVETNHIILPIVTSTPALSASFGGVTRIPTTFVFDVEGRLVTRYVNEPRGVFIRPPLEDLRRDIRGALTCGRLSLQLARAACSFLRDKDQELGLEAGPW
jgi:cytochrome c biogenesis protein CcmG/thiol:disulfide interchange protein DsbE